jgi:uncharacterized protein (DUF697 family)
MTKAKTHHTAHHTAHHGAEVVVTQKSTAEAIVSKYLPWTMGVGFVPSALLIAAGVVGIQIKMVSEIAKVYGVPFSENRAKSIVISLLGGIAPAGLGGVVGGLLASIPFVGGWILPATMPLLAGASTYAVGKIFVQHFESGGTFLSFDSVQAKELFAERFEEGKAQASKVASSFNAKLASVVDI